MSKKLDEEKAAELRKQFHLEKIDKQPKKRRDFTTLAAVVVNDFMVSSDKMQKLSFTKKMDDTEIRGAVDGIRRYIKQSEVKAEVHKAGSVVWLEKVA